PGQAALRGSCWNRAPSELYQIRFAWSHGPVFLGDKEHLDLQVCRAVLDVFATGFDRHVDGTSRLASGDGFHSESLLPVLLPGRRLSWTALKFDGLSHQALVGMQHL